MHQPLSKWALPWCLIVHGFRSLPCQSCCRCFRNLHKHEHWQWSCLHCFLPPWPCCKVTRVSCPWNLQISAACISSWSADCNSPPRLLQMRKMHYLDDSGPMQQDKSQIDQGVTKYNEGHLLKARHIMYPVFWPQLLSTWFLRWFSSLILKWFAWHLLKQQQVRGINPELQKQQTLDWKTLLQPFIWCRLDTLKMMMKFFRLDQILVKVCKKKKLTAQPLET